MLQVRCTGSVLPLPLPNGLIMVQCVLAMNRVVWSGMCYVCCLCQPCLLCAYRRLGCTSALKGAQSLSVYLPVSSSHVV